MGIMKRTSFTLIFSFLFCSTAILARTVTVENSITKKMTGYKVPIPFVGPIYPKTFSISINGNKLKPGKETHVGLNSNKLTIRYDYEFKQRPGQSGAKEVTYSIPAGINKAVITFNWKKKPRILIKGAKYESLKEISSIKE